MYSLLLNTATVSCLLFLSMLTATKKSHNPLGYRFLAVLFICLSFDFTGDIFAAVGSYHRYPWLAVVCQPVLFVFAPLIYLAVVYLTSVPQKFRSVTSCHFIPYFIILLLHIKIYFFTDADIRTLSKIALSDVKGPVDTFFVAVFFTQTAIYLYFSIRTLKMYQKTIPLFLSNITDNDYQWLYKLIIGLSVLFSVSLVEVVSDSEQKSKFFPLIYLFGFYYVGFHVVRQKDVFLFPKEQLENLSDFVKDQHRFGRPASETRIEPAGELSDSAILASADELEKAALQKKKTISDEKLTLYRERLLAIMEAEKPYIDSEITLPKLGKILLLNTYQTSYLINSSFGENFYNFINRYRLEECKRMLSSNDFSHLSILDIAFEAGFNSKTSFNTAFRKYVGCSPREFRERSRG